MHLHQAAMDLDLIIPTFNRAALLKRCLASVDRAVQAAGLRVKVIVVDNNSSDETRGVVQGFMKQSTLSMRYLFVGRCGKSAALNEALASTGAALVGLIDDDEQIDSAWFQVAYREFVDSPDLDFIGGPYRPDWEQPPPEWLPTQYLGAIGIVSRQERVRFSRGYNGILMGGNAVIRRSALEKVLPYPEDLGKLGNTIRSGEDEVIYQRLLDAEAVGLVVPDLIIKHWIPAERLTRGYFRKWVIGRGISRGSQLRQRGVNEPTILGIPRYQVGSALRGFPAMLTVKSQQVRFVGQLAILDCLATLYGRNFY